jgi:hypothetical protein
MAAKRQWDQAHASTNSASYSRLYTDEHPATTIKGLGFKNALMAQRTIRLTSQPGARYKQYWTIRAMRERANSHPNITEDMRAAISVFDHWLVNYKDPTDDEKREQRAEWAMHHKLCCSQSNRHSYGDNPTKEELQRAKNDFATAQSLLMELIQSRNKSSSAKHQTTLNRPFPLTAFVSMFGAPGFQHGYGHHHTIHHHHNHSIITSQIQIDSIQGLIELLGSSKVAKLGLVNPIHLNIKYDRCNEIVTAFQVKQTRVTLKSLWCKDQSSVAKTTSGRDVETENNRGPMAYLNDTVGEGNANVAAVEEGNTNVTLCLGDTAEEVNTNCSHGIAEEDNPNVTLCSRQTIQEGSKNLFSDDTEEDHTHITRCSGVNTRGDGQKRRKVNYVEIDQGTWNCLACTYTHDGAKQTYLACEMCGTERMCGDLDFISKGLR